MGYDLFNELGKCSPHFSLNRVLNKPLKTTNPQITQIYTDFRINTYKSG